MLNEQMRLIRKKNKYTQQQISDLLGIERSTYASYETGRNRPDIRVLSAFVKIFDVTVDYLVGIDPQKELEFFDRIANIKRRQGETILSDLNKDERELLAMYRICSDDSKEKIKTFLKDIKNEDLKNF